MLLHAIVAVHLSLAVPFTDVQGRFTIDLPDGWQFAPLPGDTAGAAFVRKADDLFAAASIRMIPVDPSSSAQVWAMALLHAVEKEPGFKLQINDDAKLGGANAARRRYAVFIDGDPRRVKVAEDRIVVQNGLAVFAHVETLDQSYAAFEPDFAKIFASLVLGRGSPAAVGNASLVVGKWLMKDTANTYLVLKPDGTFDLDGVVGNYHVQGDLLTMQQGGAPPENFTFKLEGRELILSSPNFEEPMRYTQVGGDPALVGITAQLLAGRWIGNGHKIELKPDGTINLDNAAGTYRVDGAKMTVTIGSKRIVLGFTLRRVDTLRLSGERFGKGMDLKRK